jgi:hypothetical protein
VDEAGGKAFVVETNTRVDALPEVAARLFPEGHHVTRLSTVARAADLDVDATFTSTFSGPVTTAALVAPPARAARVDVALTALACALLVVPRVGRRVVVGAQQNSRVRRVP